MSGNQHEDGDDYVTPKQQQQPSNVDGIPSLSYDADLPPVPVSSDEELTGNYTSSHIGESMHVLLPSLRAPLLFSAPIK